MEHFSYKSKSSVARSMRVDTEKPSHISQGLKDFILTANLTIKKKKKRESHTPRKSSGRKAPPNNF